MLRNTDVQTNDFPDGFKSCSGPKTQAERNRELVQIFVDSNESCIGKTYDSDDEAKKARADIALAVTKNFKGRVKVRRVDDSVYLMRAL